MSSSTQANAAPGNVKHPGHVIELSPASDRQTVRLNGALLAASTGAIVMHEGKYAPVIYFPPGDVNMDLLTRSDHSSYCPFKGSAIYWHRGDNANIAWSYETPYTEMMAIKGYIAFYADRLDSQP